MTIANGLAQFQAVGATFAGYVTPEGNLKLDSGRGATVTANFNPQTGIFRGQANSINCRYDVAWQKSLRIPDAPGRVSFGNWVGLYC